MLHGVAVFFDVLSILVISEDFFEQSDQADYESKPHPDIASKVHSFVSLAWRLWLRLDKVVGDMTVYFDIRTISQAGLDQIVDGFTFDTVCHVFAQCYC